MNDTKTPKFPSKNGLFKRENSSYWYYDIVVGGKRLKGSTHEKALYLARIVRDSIASRARSEGVDAVCTKPPTLAEFAPEFLAFVQADQTIKPRTRKQYASGLEMLLSTHLAKMQLNEITDDDCKTARFPGNASANIALAVLSKALRFAKKRKRFFGDLPEIPKRHVEPRSCCMDIDQARQIADKMRDGDAKDAFLVIRSCGMRPSEAYAMKWEFLNLGRRIYHNPTGKTKSARRMVPLVDLGLGDPMTILTRRHLEQGMPVQGWVFPSAVAPSGHIESIGKTFNTARHKAGLPKTLILYSSRHGATTDLSEVLTPREVMAIGGHSDMQVAARYQHPNVERIQDKIVTLKKVM